MEALLKIASIETLYYDRIYALHGLSLEVKEKEIFAVLGPNGAGKTTLIKLLCCLVLPNSGTAQVLGHDILREEQAVKKLVGLVSAEERSFFWRLSGRENLKFYAALQHLPGQEAKEWIEEVLDLVGLAGEGDIRFQNYSTGMRQKLAIARALLHEPQVLFLDEPTSSLDPEAARLVREFIADLKREGRTIFICTHNLNEADRLCDRIAIINTRLLALDTPSALRRQLYERTVVFHLRQAEPRFIRVVETLSYVRSARVVDNKLMVVLDDPEEHNPSIVRTLVESGADIQFVGELRRTLEDVYLKLVGKVDRGK